METIKSPLTLSNNVILETTVSTHHIIEMYKKNYNIDVSRFLQNLNQISIYKCVDTNYRFYYPFNIGGDDKFYEALQNLNGYYRDWKWEHEKIKSLIKPNNQILEIGCAYGSFLSKLKENDINGVGLELNTKAIAIGRENGLQILNETIEEHSIKNISKYDLVCSFQVMEHISNIRQVIEASIKTLKSGGILAISVPNDDSYLGLDNENMLNLPPHHMGLWNRESLNNLTKIFPIKLKRFYFEPLQKEQQGYYKHQIYLKRYKKYENRLKKYGLLGRISNRVETLVTPILYPSLSNLTIIGVFVKI